MEENQKRDVGRALTTDEIRLQAHKWNLAGDVGLLAHLENFSQNLVRKSQETQKNLNDLLDSFEDTSTTINNVTNQFLALQNSQFVENRVYDDESPAEEPKSDEKISQEEQESYLLARYKEAVEIGVKLLDTHFEEVQLPPNSDSDDEEVSIENSGLVWKPKNPYAGKRFPLLIGSAEWWADDNVGLGEYEENINHDTPSSEPESDMEAEDAAEKRIRMSSSSSTESEKVLSKKPKGENPEFDDIFAPPEKDMFGAQSNLFKNDEDDVPKPQILPRSREHIKPLHLPNTIEDEERKMTNSVPTKNKNSIFDDEESGDSEEEYQPEPAPVNKQNRLQDALTRELTGKLSSVLNKKEGDGPKPAKRESIKTDNNESSALFAENDDNDDLFSAKNPASNLLFKKQSIFSENDADDELFSDSGNLLTGNKPKISSRVNVESASDSNPSKDNKTSNLFDESSKFSEDDLFGNNDDFLFTGKSVLSSSRNSGVAGPGWKGSREVKFSTPTEQRDIQEVPHGDIFGGVSEIRSNGSSNVASVSAISNDMNNSFIFSRYLSVETSKDDGFVEPSDASNNKSVKSDSSGLFEPRLTSTRHIPSDTSDYKTQRVSTRPSQSNSSGLESEDNSKGKMGHSEKVHFPRHQGDPNKNKSLFEEEDEDDDLFQASKPSKPVKESSLFDDKDTDDLFSNLPSKNNKGQPIFDEKEENSVLFQKSSVPLLDGDEGEKSSLLDRVKQDSVSMSSSRSSLFDDVNVGGKTNLASVFENDKSAKNSDDLFGKTGDDLFGEKKVVTFDENDADDLFGDGAISKPGDNHKDMSLFDNLEDADDLFGDNVSKKLFGNYDDDGDLFGKTSKDNVKEKSVKPVSQSHVEDVSKSEASLVEKEPIHPVTAVSEETDNLFDDIFDKSDEISKKNDDVSGFEDATKPRSSAVTSIFGDFEDEDENLFSKSNMKATKSDSQGLNILQDDFEDDIFKAGPTTEKILEDKAVKYDDKIVPSGNELFIEPEISQGVNSEKTNESAIGDSKQNVGVVEKKDLFEDKTLKSKVLENRKLFEMDDTDDNNLFNTEPTEENRLSKDKSELGVRPSPPKTLNISKGLDLSGKHKNNVCETDGSVMSSEKPKVIGKLNIPSNLKINPMSLLPGAVMKKSAPVENTTEVDEPDNGEEEGWKDDAKPTETGSNLLKCLSKDRVKIQTRRRPQTRRARQEALRSSGIDFHVGSPEVGSVAARSRSVDDFEKGEKLPSKSNSDTNVNDSCLVNERKSDAKVLENADSSNSIFHSVENSPEPLFSSPLVSNPLSPSTDEEDYINVPELDTNFEREDQSIFKSDVTDFTNDDTLLFDGAPVLSPMNPTKNIITSPDKPEKPGEKKPSVKKKTDNLTPGGIIKSRIIIDDEEDEKDDDYGLFNTNATKKLGTPTQKKAEVKSRTSNIFDDLEESDTFLFQNKTVGNLGAKVPKTSLFDENDEDDDLFSDKPVSSSSTGKIENDSTIKNKVNKVNAVEKSKETFVDPLGLMTSSD